MIKTYDSDWAEVANPDLTLGKLVPAKRFVTHHDEIPEKEYIEDFDLANPIREYPNGGKEVALIVVQEYAPKVDAWDEYEECFTYTPYTPAELDEIARKKAAEDAAIKEATERAAAEAAKAAEREKFLASAPARIETVELIQLDTDEAVAAIYENLVSSQLDTDEAIVTIYETLGVTK